jgi:hypothetical protein
MPSALYEYVKEFDGVVLVSGCPAIVVVAVHDMENTWPKVFTATLRLGRGKRYHERAGVSKKSTLGSGVKPKFTYLFSRRPQQCYTLVSTNTSDS